VSSHQNDGHLIEHDEWEVVARLLGFLNPFEGGRFPGVQLSVVDGHRRWTMASAHGQVTVNGGPGPALDCRPPWLPYRLTAWARDLSRTSGVARLAFERGVNGHVATIAASGGSGRFDLPGSTTVVEVVGDLDPTGWLAYVWIETDYLQRVLECSANGPERPRLTSDPLRLALSLDHDSISLGMDWTPVGGERSTYRIPANVQLGEGHHATVVVDQTLLMLGGWSCPDERVWVGLRADGSARLLAGYIHTELRSLRNAPAPVLDLDTMLTQLGATRTDGEIAVPVAGRTVRLRPPSDVGQSWRAEVRIATGIAPSLEVLEELNELNTRATFGRISLDAGTVVATTAIPSVELGHLPAVLERLVADTAGLGPCLGGLTGPSGARSA
jgi:hypothetical protein